MAFCLTLLYIVLLFISIPDTLPQLAPYRIQLVLGLLAIVATGIHLFFKLPLHKDELRLNPQYWLMAAFTMWVWVSWWPHLWFGGTFLGIFLFTPFGCLFFLVGINTTTMSRLRTLRAVLMVTTVYLLMQGFYSYYFAPEESPYLFYQNTVNGLDLRLQGLGMLGDPNQYAQFLLLLLPFVFVDWKNRSFISRFGLVLPFSAILFWGVFLTKSRGAILGTSILIVVALRRKYSALRGPVSLVVGMAVIAAGKLLVGRDISRSGGLDRLALWSEGLGMVKSSPLWGIGYKGFMERADLTAHNSYLLCASELGFIGYFFWAGLVLVAVWQLRVIRDRDASDDNAELRNWASATLLAFYTFLVTAFFLSQTYAPALYVLLGISAAIIGMDIRQRNQRLLPSMAKWASLTLVMCIGSIVLIYFSVLTRIM